MAINNLIFKLFEEENRQQSYPKGTVVVHQGGSTDFVYFITEGLIKVGDSDFRGEGRTLSIFSKGHVFPISWLLKDQPQEGTLYDYEAITPTKAYVMRREDLRTALDAHPQVYIQLVDVLVKTYVNAGARITNLQKTNVSERLEFVLYYLAMMLGGKSRQGIVNISIPITHQEIADLAGLSREAVSRELSKDKYDKIYQKVDHHTIINLNHLNLDNFSKVYPLSI
jgi:CRP/FNR family transcriptional regulator, cyclic AMP receptor protein